jgi:Ca-activated chloride channel family protein
MALRVPREEATVMLTMDVSRSMDATDVDPTRLAAAKAAASSFVDSLPSAFRVGLIAFSTDAHLLVAPTADRGEIHDAIDNLHATGGTALGDAIALSVDATADARAASSDSPAASTHPSAGPSASATPNASGDPNASADPANGGSAKTPVTATVLLSDGANSTGSREPLDAASDAVAAGMPIYTIALGTPNGVVDVEDQSGQTQQLPVPPDTQTLEQVASMTGGRAFDAPTAKDLAQIYESLGSKVGFTIQEQEVTQWFAAGALLLVIVGGGLSALWFNRFP